MIKCLKSLKDFVKLAKEQELVLIINLVIHVMVKEFRMNPEVLNHPPIPQPLHGVNPRTILGRKWWDEERKKAYKSTEYHCIACGVHKSKAKGPKHLEGHEHYEIDYVIGTLTYVRAIPLCNYCHSYIHFGRLNVLLSQRKISRQKYHDIMVHGDSVLAKIGLEKSLPKIPHNVALWDDWRLILEGKKYKPLITFEEFKEQINNEYSSLGYGNDWHRSLPW